MIQLQFQKKKQMQYHWRYNITVVCFFLAMQISKESIKGLNIEYVDISPLPFLNTDLEVDGTYPPEVEAFREKIRQADCYLFASPEYNYSVTGTQKQPNSLLLNCHRQL